MPPGKATNGTGLRAVKVVVTGPFGAGKTSLIKSISEIAVLSTERQVTDRTPGGDPRVKAQTTVAMDFGRITVGREPALYLFGTPGQKRFDFMWEILAEGMLGFIVIVDAEREASAREAAEILTFFNDMGSVPYVIAVNKSDADPRAAVARVRETLALDAHVRVVACNALDRESAKSVLLELLYAALDEIEADEPAGAIR